MFLIYVVLITKETKLIPLRALPHRIRITFTKWPFHRLTSNNVSHYQMIESPRCIPGSDAANNMPHSLGGHKGHKHDVTFSFTVQATGRQKSLPWTKTKQQLQTSRSDKRAGVFEWTAVNSNSENSRSLPETDRTNNFDTILILLLALNRDRYWYLKSVWIETDTATDTRKMSRDWYWYRDFT